MTTKPITKPFLLTCILLGAMTLPLCAQTQPAQTAPPAPLVQTHPATVEQIHEYYAITHSIEMAHKVMDQMVVAMQSTSPDYLPKDFWEDMRQSLATVDLEAAFVPAYQKYFSQEDMQSVIEFYKSPAGQHLLAAQPLITSYAQEQLHSIGAKIGQEVYLRHKDEIEAARNKYEESQHPQPQPNASPSGPPSTQKQ